ncbi:MAG: hypothetical protein ICV78_16350 [Tolypothrix sp. Co-bin9]|nr:hypothetical protein [Tolypothrix sp. Co-bin9]
MVWRQDGNIGGKQPEWVFLTEDQATFLMTLSRNTPEVVECKKELVRKFSEAKRLLRQRGIYEQPHTTVYIRRLENMTDHDVPDHLWTTFREGAETLLMVEKHYKIPVSQMDLCDGSIGRHWSEYRKTQVWTASVGEYAHRFRDQRGERFCKAYEHSELAHFKRWLRENYVPKHLPQYLVDKYGKRAVRQIYEEIAKLDEYILQITEEKRPSSKQEEMYNIFLAAREAIANRYFFGDN